MKRYKAFQSRQEILLVRFTIHRTLGRMEDVRCRQSRERQINPPVTAYRPCAWYVHITILVLSATPMLHVAMYLESFNQKRPEELRYLQHSVSSLRVSDISKTCHITPNQSAIRLFSSPHVVLAWAGLYCTHSYNTKFQF
jgi:hypothetical protein